MTAEDTFMVGDTVQLKSGGQIMTVKSFGIYKGQRKVVCIWFDGTKRMDGVFLPATLKAEA